MTRGKAALAVAGLAAVCAVATVIMLWDVNAQVSWGNHADLTGGNGDAGFLWLIFLPAMACMATSAALIGWQFSDQYAIGDMAWTLGSVRL